MEYYALKMMVVVTNLENVLYLVKNVRYNFVEAVNLFNEVVYRSNKVENLKDLKEAADDFLKNCYTIGIEYEQ